MFVCVCVCEEQYSNFIKNVPFLRYTRLCNVWSVRVIPTYNIIGCCWFGVKNDDKLGVFIQPCDLASVHTSATAEPLSQSLTELLFHMKKWQWAVLPNQGRLESHAWILKDSMLSEHDNNDN